MREVNFSIPNVNKASVSITTTLYDRRALDCTSNLPLVNSLNHLSYLTSSSPRIRDILCYDGAIERLVCILKEGRGTDVMDVWKWNLSLQCLVNIGVRGSESVRTRLVEADIVPVIATILHNHIKIVEKLKARADAERNTARVSARQSHSRPSTRSREHGSRSFFDRSMVASEQRQNRRQAPPPSIEIPQQIITPPANESEAMDMTPAPYAVTSPPERTTFANTQPDGDTLHRHDHRSRLVPPATAVPTIENIDGFGFRPVRDADRLPSMLPASHAGLASQPDSPTTPGAPMQSRELASPVPQSRLRPSIRQQRSTSADSDDATGEEALMEDAARSGDGVEPIVDIQNEVDIDMEDVTTSEDILTNAGLTSEINDAEPFDASTSVEAVNFPGAPATASVNAPSPTPSIYTLNTLRERSPPGLSSVMPRDEDVLMTLQLLAYVSKYCNLRSYFQNTHYVPKLRIHPMVTGEFVPGTNYDDFDADEDEFLLPDNVNVFPIVEKFTVRHYSKDMQYWACVVMRNLCRKDEQHGGIRQCAYWQCGKWEEYQRQFAKCRRCRRTKYCSKECQKSAWVYHRHWCHDQPAEPREAQLP